jgi:two-component system, sensor histidine kinase
LTSLPSASYDPEGLNEIDGNQLLCQLKEGAAVGSFIRSGCLVIEIVDHGPGMDEEEMSQVFREGVRFNPNQLQAGQGSGLGLWISRGLIDLHLGRLTAFSEGVGLGSTFTIQIPLFEPTVVATAASPPLLVLEYHPVSQTSQEEKEEAIRTGTQTTPTLVPETPHYSVKDLQKILIVDDAATNRKIVRRILRGDGFSDVDEAKDGQECLEMVLSRPPHEAGYDLILMDYEMPRMNGPTAVMRLRELGYSVPIIGVTGNLLNADVTFFIQSGADAVLPKPIVMKDLYEAYGKIKQQ